MLRLLAVLGMLAPEIGHAAPPACADLGPGSAASASVRAVTADDLLRLRDIGRGEDGLFDESPLALSPDGSMVAFQLRRADSKSNSYCLGIFVMQVRPGARPRQVDAGGELITGTMSIRGLAAFPLGTPKLIVPRWSPDGQWLAYLRADGGHTRIWLARADGRGARQLTPSATDIEAFAWGRDGRSIVYATRPRLEAAHAAIAREGLSGFLYDDRFSPIASDRPFVREPIQMEWSVIDVASSNIRPATADEQSLAERPDGAAAIWGDRTIVSAGGVRATKISVDPHAFLSPKSLQLEFADGRVRRCPDNACAGAVDLWWSASGSELWFLRREGWGSSQMALYRWRAGSRQPRRVLVTDGVLVGCQPTRDRLLCLFEDAVRPNRLLLIDPATGRTELLFDLNPEFGSFRLGKVKRLEWRNSVGLESFADLVLPPDHRPGERHPLVVVQYQSRGFLRGGTGDEFPIQALAARGHAVLSFQRPRDYFPGPARTSSDYHRASRKDWADRRSVLSSLEGLIGKAIATGAIDPARIGLTGLSDGASTVQFALVNGSVPYKAVSLASCCEERATFGTLGGPAFESFLRSTNYPAWGDVGDPWKAYSLAENVDRIRAPILMQLADSEYELSLETVSALRAARRPVELYVFPDERHIKWQPAHRRAIYERNLDWFDYWLHGRRDVDQAKRAQYQRWDALADVP